MPSTSPQYKNPEQVKHKASPPNKKKRLNLTSLALACDRTGVSYRAAAIIASSVLKDVGIIETWKDVVKNGLSMCQIIDFPYHT